MYLCFPPGVIGLIWVSCHPKLQVVNVRSPIKEAWVLFCLWFHILITSEVMSRRVLICDSVYSCQLNSAAPLENQATITITRYPLQSHYPDTEPVMMIL